MNTKALCNDCGLPIDEGQEVYRGELTGATWHADNKTCFALLKAALNQKRPSVKDPERCAKFVAYLHALRKELGVAPVSDEDAAKVFDMIEDFWGDLEIKRA